MAKLKKISIGPSAAGERDESEVRWLMSYSDFMMQLVCLFILLYSVSSLDKGRMARVAASFRASIGEGNLAASETKTFGDRLAVGDRMLLGGDLGGGDLPAYVRYRIEPVEGGIRVEFPDPVFAPGASTLDEPGAKALDGLARRLRAYAGRVVVTGGGDDLPAGEALALAVARARTTADRLARAGLDPRFITVSGRTGKKARRVQIDLELH